MWCHYWLAPFGVKKRKKEQADVKKEQVVYEMNRMWKIEERSFRTCGATIDLLLFGVKKRKKEQANVKKEQVVYEIMWVVVSCKRVTNH